MARLNLLLSLLVILPCLAEDTPHAVVSVEIVGPDGRPARARLLAHPVGPLEEGTGEKVQEVNKSAPLSLPPGQWVLSASAEGLASEPALLELRHGEVVWVTLTLAPAGTVEGRVTRPDGTPASGARVRGLIVGADYLVCASATTDADGRYELFVEPGPVCPYAESEGLLSLCGRVEATREAKVSCDLTLLDGKSISGRILDKGGEGVPEAKVHVFSRDLPPDGRIPNFCRSVVSGANGEFEVAHLPEGAYGLYARAEGHIQEDPQQVTAGTAHLAITLKDGGRIEGKVILPEGVAGDQVMVGAVGVAGTFGRTKAIAVRDDGTFVIELLPQGLYSVVAQAKGYAPTFSNSVDVQEGGTTGGVSLELSRGGALRGHVVAPQDGKPVCGATVSIGTDLHNAWHFSPIDRLLDSVTTDADGAFHWEDLPPGKYELEVRHPDFGPQERTVRIEKEKTTEIEVELPSPARVFGRVVGQGCTMSDKEGRYEHAGLPPGDVFVECREGGTGLGFFDFEYSMSQRVHLDPGQSLEVNFPPEGGVRIFGVVRCGKEILSDATVTMDSPGSSGSKRTNANGEYELRGLAPGKCYVRVVGMEQSRFEIPEGVKEFRKDFDLPAGKLTGRVRVAATGNPPEIVGVTVFAERDRTEGPSMREAGSCTAKPDGTFEVIALKAGKYTVIVRSYPLATEILRNVEVPENGAAKPLAIDLILGGGMRLCVSDEDGKAIENVFLALWEMPSKIPMEIIDPDRSESGRAGVYEIRESIRPGDYILGVIEGQHMPVGVPVHVTAGEDITVRATLRRGGMAILKVKDGDGDLVDDATVVVFDADGNPIDTSLGLPTKMTLGRPPAGTIGVPLPVGRYHGEVTSGDRKGTFEVTIKEQERAEVEVILRAQ